MTPEQRERLSALFLQEARVLQREFFNYMSPVLQAKRVRLTSRRKTMARYISAVDIRLVAAHRLSEASHLHEVQDCIECPHFDQQWGGADYTKRTCLALPSGMFSHGITHLSRPVWCPVWGDVSKHSWWIDRHLKMGWEA